MEWLPVNQMLPDEITKLTYTLVPPGFHGDVHAFRLMQECLSRIINRLGEQSAAEQGLNKVITTAEKLRNSPEHILYLLKDPHANGNKGEVLGMLKVGRKHLFLYDERGGVHEVEPLCVLDFFVLPPEQRHGHGRRLFDFMLKEAGVTANELAIDGPSDKMEQFLQKNYGFDKLLRQNNNFAVAPDFFPAHIDISGGRDRERIRDRALLAPPLGRFAAARPVSDIATVIHGGADGFGTASGKSSRASTPAPVEEVPAAAASEADSDEIAAELDRIGLGEEPAAPERPTTLHVDTAHDGARSPEANGARSPAANGERSPAANGARSPAANGERGPSPAGISVVRRDSQLTEQGYFDVKFYHNKLW